LYIYGEEVKEVVEEATKKDQVKKLVMWL